MSLARLRALVVLGLLGAIALATVIWAIAHDSQENGHASGCGAKAVETKVPAPSGVKLRILNATDRNGLAGELRDELAARGFTQIEVGDSSAVVEGTAMVRYGPAAAGAAQLVRAQVPAAVADPVDDREDEVADVVDLLIGPDYQNLTPNDQVSTVMKQLKPVTPSTDCTSSKS